QMLVGGLVGSSGASLACPDFPFCQPERWYGIGGAQFLQMLHRLMAVLLLPLLLLNIKAGAVAYSGHRVLLFFFVFLPICLYLLQVLLGWLNLLLGIPVFITVSHLFTAQLLLQTQVQNLRLQARS
ncbi:MAG: COX15/CtaA family protein, partial [bacterium]|nr:COX15/CtaA family protein [bacterium]